VKITHAVVTDAFAGTERYVCEIARRQAQRGHDVVVLGGSGVRMRAELEGAVWQHASTVPTALARIVTGGQRDVVHAHLTKAELAGALAKPAHGGLLVSTRHIAAPRGRSRRGRFAAPVVARSVDVEIAISRHVAAAMERPPHLVLHNGVAASGVPYDTRSRTVLVLQRLAPEKDTETALRAWGASHLGDCGWHLDVAGGGEQREALERLTRQLRLRGVRFLGEVNDAATRLATAGLLLAPAPSEPLGLSVLEAMAQGVPVVVSASGGHLETVPPGWAWVFPPGDADAAGVVLAAAAADDQLRVQASGQVRSHAMAHFDVERHVDDLTAAYESSPAHRLGLWR